MCFPDCPWVEFACCDVFNGTIWAAEELDFLSIMCFCPGGGGGGGGGNDVDCSGGDVDAAPPPHSQFTTDCLFCPGLTWIPPCINIWLWPSTTCDCNRKNSNYWTVFHSFQIQQKCTLHFFFLVFMSVREYQLGLL